MSYFFASVSQFTANITNKLTFSKKQEEEKVVVPSKKYNLDAISKKLAGIQQELRNMPDIDIKVSQPDIAIKVSQPSSSITAMQRLNAELQEIYELQQKNVETMKKLQALRQNNVESMKQVQTVCNSIYD
jgi:hypothetical protein